MCNVQANTILSSLATLFTFILSVLVLKESMTLRKITGVVFCILGETPRPKVCAFGFYSRMPNFLSRLV